MCRPLAIKSDDADDFYDSDGPVYDPTADDFSDDELTEEEAAVNAEISRYMDVLVPRTEQELASSPFQHGAEWYNDTSSDESADDKQRFERHGWSIERLDI